MELKTINPCGLLLGEETLPPSLGRGISEKISGRFCPPKRKKQPSKEAPCARKSSSSCKHHIVAKVSSQKSKRSEARMRNKRCRAPLSSWEWMIRIPMYDTGPEVWHVKSYLVQGMNLDVLGSDVPQIPLGVILQVIGNTKPGHGESR